MEKQSSKFSSPFKTGKYKSFFTSFLSPSVPKRPVRRKDSSKFHSSHSIEDESLYKKHSFQASHHSSDSIYSTIESLGEQSTSRCPSRRLKSDSNLNENPEIIPDQLNIEKGSLQLDATVVKEPLYATVNKEDNRILKETIKGLSEENRLLRKKLEDFIKEEKRKEDTLHSKLHLKITELEAETRKDVKCLSDRIHILIREKDTLNDQIDILQMERKATQIKHDDLCNKLRSMVPSDIHKKHIAEQQKLMNDTKKKHKEEIDKLKELYNVLDESKVSSEHLVKELETKVITSETKINSLEKTIQDFLEEKSNYILQAEESRQMEQDMQSLLLSLLKATENIAMERNVLLDKTSFQDHQQKEIQTTVIDYSLNIGRLQEHILNLNKDKHQELIKLKSNKHQQDENLQLLYGKQLDILREKILAQHNIINDLENDKRKLESQLELIWQAACGKNSKLFEDVKDILHSKSLKK